MSLTNIQLPPLVIQQLYKDALIETETNKPSPQEKQSASINILGKNKKGIIILVSDTKNAYLPDDELNFLLGILSACKLNMDDVGIVNLKKNKGLLYSTIAAELNAGKVFLFGIDTDAIELPLGIPLYQIQQYNNQTYLSAPALAALKDDKAEKTKLWNSLKSIFDIG